MELEASSPVFEGHHLRLHDVQDTATTTNKCLCLSVYNGFVHLAWWPATAKSLQVRGA